MKTKILELSQDDLELVVNALRRYYDWVHPANSSKQDVARLIDYVRNVEESQ